MLEFLTLACGLLMPFLVSWLKNCDWPDWIKVLLSLGMSIIAGGLITFLEGAFDIQTLTQATTAVFTSATVFYKMWFEKTKVNERLEQAQPLGADGLLPPHNT